MEVQVTELALIISGFVLNSVVSQSFYILNAVNVGAIG